MSKTLYNDKRFSCILQGVGAFAILIALLGFCESGADTETFWYVVLLIGLLFTVVLPAMGVYNRCPNCGRLHALSEGGDALSKFTGDELSSSMRMRRNRATDCQYGEWEGTLITCKHCTYWFASTELPYTYRDDEGKQDWGSHFGPSKSGGHR